MTAAPQRHVVLGMSTAAAVGLAVGVFTAYAQGWLGDSTASLANSAGPWSLAAFLVARFNRRLPAAIAAAMLTLACCELGYALATTVRGGTNSSSTVLFWLTAAALAGPPLGIAGSWSVSTGVRRGLGWSVIGGVLLGEGVYGWTTVADTTDWRYWAVETVVGSAIVVVAVVRSAWPRGVALTCALGCLTAGVVFAAGRLV